MADSNWIEKKINLIDKNYDKYETHIQIVFALVLAAFPFAFSGFMSLATQGDSMTQDPILSMPGIISIILFYIIAFCIWMMIRHAGKSKTNKKLDSLTNEIHELVKRIDERWPK
jgi:hypothetical protein